MSDDESSNTSGGGEITLYECRKCPGQRFTAPERDNHRLQHRRERERSRGSRGRGRASSPNRSEATLFDEVVVREDENGEEVVTPSPGQKKGKRKSTSSPAPKKKKEAKKSRRKRQSVKHYDQKAMDNKTKSNGA